MADCFIKIPGVTGEAADSKHQGEIDVLRWGWSAQNPSGVKYGGGSGLDKATISDLRFDHEVDRASPVLFKMAVAGDHIPEVTLTCRKPGGSPLEYLVITLKQVFVTNIAQSGGGSSSHESVTLSFAEFTQKYTAQKGVGSGNASITMGFDFKEHKLI